MKRKLALLLCLCVLTLPIMGLAAEDSEETTHWAEDYESAVTGNCSEYVNVREGAGKDYDVIGRAALGEEIKLLQWNSDESWCKVLYNDSNNIGWVYKDYIIPEA